MFQITHGSVFITVLGSNFAISSKNNK